MNFKKMLWVSICMLMLTACGVKPNENEVNLSLPQVKVNQDASTVTDQADADSVAKAEWDKIVDFQREVIPVLEEVLIKQFPMKVNKTGTPTIDIDGDALLEQATSYFDNDDVNNLKIVFLVDKEDATEMMAIRKELEEKLGDKVVFKKAKHNPKVLRDMAKEVDEYLHAKILSKYETQSAYSVGYNSREEVIDIRGKLTDEHIAELTQKFGADRLKIDPKEFHTTH
ncbi:hypothetical protein [Paenibacillus arenilitoris]|nr:hypothetical protein [Paenibacillus arenilitoris]